MASTEDVNIRPGVLQDVLCSEPEPVPADVVISSLPEEIWLKVLRLLTSWELCQAGLVSRQLLRLTRDPSLWTEIRLVGDAIAGTATVSTLFRQVTR